MCLATILTKFSRKPKRNTSELCFDDTALNTCLQSWLASTAAPTDEKVEKFHYDRYQKVKLQQASVPTRLTQQYLTYCSAVRMADTEMWLNIFEGSIFVSNRKSVRDMRPHFPVTLLKGKNVGSCWGVVWFFSRETFFIIPFFWWSRIDWF